MLIRSTGTRRPAAGAEPRASAGPAGAATVAGDTDGCGHQGAGAQESATAQLTGVSAFVMSGVHGAISFPARAKADRDDDGATVWRSL
nr:hypothetical protein GCM10020092_034730 [Actinoplanes digitatis]